MNLFGNLRKTILTTIAIFSVTGAIVTTSSNPVYAGSPDARIQEALDSIGMKYTIDKDGDFKIILEYNDKRSQAILINSVTTSIKDSGLEMRDIISVAYQTKGDLSVEVANQLLKNSRKLAIGAWELMSFNDGTSLVIFNAKVDAKMSEKDLLKTIKIVGAIADEMEKELSSGDKF